MSTSSGESTIRTPAATVTSKMRFCSPLAPVERRACELQARHAAVLGDAHIVEAVEDALRPEMDLDRHLEELLDAGVDRAGLGPRRDDVDRVGAERARAVDRLAQVGSSAARRSSRVANESSRVSGAAPTMCSPKFHG